MDDYFVSLIRTWVPIGIGNVLAWLAVHFGVIVDADSSTQFKLGAAAVVVAGYYAVARLVEERWPAVGRFLVALGLRRAPATYGPAQR
ncbi:hypothetical protein [Actinomadura bangladeshensis]|uniref:Uncharacterized protein n=1 Tax=Actinomadura bangladeshensis TaxID=453573 RepID=A0A6L9QD52_9ACTN|nr:hypothetical protein [Actinomadura bangladeshensis]NEA22603.1 hypothetical protein [Actinomadura bangladeshensis]